MENETFQAVQISGAESLQAITRSEIDSQIATAKQFPRDVQASIARITQLATLDEETAQECFYALKKDGQLIEGPSIRLAEIVATSWGNIRAASHIVGNDGKFITAQGVCIDLETNVGISCETKRRITTRDGRTYGDDMQMVTGNAAGAIALRNAILKVVPKAALNKAMKQVKAIAVGKGNDLVETRQKILATFAKYSVTEPMILSFLNIASVEDITQDMVVTLRGVNNAIKEGQTTAAEQFIKPYQAKQATSQSGKVPSKVAAAMQKQNDFAEEIGDDDLSFLDTK